MNISPLGDWMLVNRIKEDDRTKGGLILPDTAKKKSQRGLVLAIGPGELTEDGMTRRPTGVKKGDKILFHDYAGAIVKVNGEEYLLMSVKDIMATFTVEDKK